MLSLEAELREHLQAGGTLAVVSRQRAAAVQLAYAQARIAAGDQTWPSPDVLPVATLVARESASQRQKSGTRRRQLTAVEEWALWRDAALETGASLQLLSLGALVDGLRSNYQLLAEWGLGQGILANPEGEWLLRSRRRYQQRRDALQALDSDGWRSEAQPLAGRVLLAHPDECGTATRQTLAARGARSYQPASADATAGQVVAASNADAELDLMARWARRELLRDPGARLLLVVPELSTRINEIQRFLDETLHEAEIGGDTESGHIAYAIEGGLELSGAPLVQSALWAVRMAAGQTAFAEAASLLRSACLQAGLAPARLALEPPSAMRRYGMTEGGWQQLAELANAAALDGRDWLVRIATLVSEWRHAPVLPSRWAQRFADLWRRLGWPGDATLGSAEQQRRMRFDELVGEFASLDDSLGALQVTEALEVLTAWVHEARFEAASGDVPVTVSARLDDPLVRYDGIWVAGLTAGAWPPPAELSGFVAATALQQAGNPRASADGQLALAQRCMRHWSHRSVQLVYSWARVSGEAEASPSPLLAGFEPLDLADLLPATRAGILQPAASLENCGPDVARPWPAGTRVPGGVGLLQAQSHCPFKASAMARLGCKPLSQPAAGVSAQLHGEIMHSALRRLWGDIGGSEALRARALDERAARATAAARAAIDAVRDGKGRCVDAMAWQVELERCVRLLAADLAAEALRAPFTLLADERSEQLSIGELRFQLRLDRVDELAATEVNGAPRRVLIDYKTGKPERADFTSMRPQQLQLQAYAQQVDGLAAAVTLHLHKGAARWAGVAEDSDLIPGIKAQSLPWPELQQRWREMLASLGRQFAAGQATVDPLQNVCKQCGLQLLCRIDAELLEDCVAGAEDEDGDE